MNATRTLKLDHPIERGSELITELEMKEPLVGDLRRALDKEGQATQTAALIAACAGQLPAVIDRMHLTDYVRAQALMMELLPPELTGQAEEEASGEEGKAGA